MWSLSGLTRKHGMAQTSLAIPTHFLVVPDKIDIKRHKHGILYLSQLMRLWYLSHRWPAKAQASLRIRTVSPEPSLFAYMKYRSRQGVWPKIRHLSRWMAANELLKNEFTEDKKCHNLICDVWLKQFQHSSSQCFSSIPKADSNDN